LKTITIFIVAFFVSFASFSQHTQTNAPNYIFPLLDDYIKQGFDRNYRAHMRILKQLDFIYLTNVPAKRDRFTLPFSYGDHLTVIVYKYHHRELGQWRYVMAINEVWKGNPYVLRRLFYKGMAMVYEMQMIRGGFGINTDRDMYDFKLILYDLTENNWKYVIDDFFKDASARFPLSHQ
jgi:hypothetical protein